MTAATQPVTAGQQLIFSACAAVDTLEQVQAVLTAISAGVADEGKAKEVRLQHIGTLAEIAQQMLIDTRGEIEGGLDAATGLPLSQIESQQSA